MAFAAAAPFVAQAAAQGYEHYRGNEARKQGRSERHKANAAGLPIMQPGFGANFSGKDRKELSKIRSDLKHGRVGRAEKRLMKNEKRFSQNLGIPYSGGGGGGFANGEFSKRDRKNLDKVRDDLYRGKGKKGRERLKKMEKREAKAQKRGSRGGGGGSDYGDFSAGYGGGYEGRGGKRDRSDRSGMSSKERKMLKKEQKRFEKYEKASGKERKKMEKKYGKEFKKYEKERTIYNKRGEKEYERKSRESQKLQKFNLNQLKKYGSEKMIQKPRLTKDQQNLLGYLSKYGQGIPQIPGIHDNPLYQAGSQGLMDMLSQNPESYQRMIDPLLRKFQKDVLPGIKERFTELGGGRNSALPIAMAEASKDLMSELGAMRANMLPGAIGQALEYAQMPTQQAFNEAQMRLGAGGQALGVDPYNSVYRPASYANAQDVSMPVPIGPQQQDFGGYRQGAGGISPYMGAMMGGAFAPRAPAPQFNMMGGGMPQGMQQGMMGGGMGGGLGGAAFGAPSRGQPYMGGGMMGGQMQQRQRRPGLLDYIGQPVMNGIGQSFGQNMGQPMQEGLGKLGNMIGSGIQNLFSGSKPGEVPGTNVTQFQPPRMRLPNFGEVPQRFRTAT